MRTRDSTPHFAFNDVGQFDCSTSGQHKGENLVKHGTKGDKEVYEKAIRAKSTLELQHLKSNYSSKGAAYLAKTPDDRLYLVSSGPRNCGKTSSPVAESSNATILSVHAASIATGLLWVFEREMTRIEAHKKEAERHQGTLVPFAMKQVQKMDEAAVEFSRVVELISPTRVKVYSCGSAKVSYDVKGDDRMHCSCNMSVMAGDRAMRP